MLLTCPTCQSGLQVPDGTAAMVRCPACKTVFAPADGLVPPEPEPLPDDEPKKPRKAKPVEDDEPKSENRDFDPIDPEAKPKRRRPQQDDGLSPADRAILRAAFDRAAWGCKLIWVSFLLFMLSMTLIGVYLFQFGFARYGGLPSPGWITAAGVTSIIYWILGAAGIGLCLSGPRGTGHWGYGIAAAVASGVHLILLIVLASQADDILPATTDSDVRAIVRWRLLPTQLDNLGFSLTYIVYHNEDIVPKKVGLYIMVGVAELLRNVLIVMLLSSLARASGDKELSNQCTRAAGYASFGPGVLALVMLGISVVMYETNGALFKLNDALFRVGTTFNPAAMVIGVIYMTATMGIYAILMGMMLPALMVARETADACDEPFQPRIPHY